MKTLVVIPAHNEDASLDGLIAQLRALPVGSRFDVLVVDDGSQDNTAQVARDAGATVVSLFKNLGYGCALRAGYEYARRNNYDTIVQLDGDGQHDPASVPVLLNTLTAERCDVVIGSRFNEQSDYSVPTTRRLGQRFFSRMLYWLGHVKIQDVTSGFQVIGPRAFRLYLSNEFPSDYPDVNVLLYLTLHGMKIREAPAVFHANRTGTSMHRGVWRPIFYVYKMTFSTLLVYLRYRNTTRGVQEQ